MEDRDGATVTELRLRLYRPDPPIGAVDAYLLALAETTPPPVVAAPHERRGSRGALTAVLVLALVAIAGVVVARGAAATTTSPVAPVRETGLAYPEVPGYPIGRLSGERAASGRFRANGARVVVSVFCSGNGVVTLRLGAESPTDLTCEPGGPALAMLESSAVLDRFTIDVTAQPGVRWTLSAGALALPQT